MLGIFLLLTVFLSRNFGATEKLTATFEEIGEDVVILSSDEDVRPENAGKVVFFSSKNIKPSSAALTDDDFGLNIEGAIRLRRNTEHCQWQEIQEEIAVTLDDGTEGIDTTYSYEKVWSEDFIESINFKKRKKHRNRQKSPMPSKKKRVKNFKAGDFTMGKEIINKMTTWYPWVPTPEFLKRKFLDTRAARHTYVCLGSRYFFKPWDDQKRAQVMEAGSMILNNQYLDPNTINELFGDCNPGDSRVSFDAWTPDEITVLARQIDEKGTLMPFDTAHNYDITFVQRGNVPFPEFLKNELIKAGELAAPESSEGGQQSDDEDNVTKDNDNDNKKNSEYQQNSEQEKSEL